MPYYDFHCSQCNETFEINVPMSRIGHSKIKCQECGSELRRVYHFPAVIFEEGIGGFYKKDYGPQPAKEKEHENLDRDSS